MSSSQKKVIVRMFSTEGHAGYLAMDGFGGTVDLEMLDLAGKVLTFPLAEVKWVCFVRDFNSGEIDNPERLLKKTFTGRPRTTGLWLRLRLTDGDLIEGLAENDLGLITGAGLFVTPPDIRSNTQRIFLPRSSIAELEVVQVIIPARKRKGGGEHLIEDRAKAQESLFP